jgi:hypothetical protein
MSLGAQLRRAVESSFTDQAREHGAELGKRAAEMRARDPLATFLLDTFTRQVPRYAQRAFAAHAAGDRRAGGRDGGGLRAGGGEP